MILQTSPARTALCILSLFAVSCVSALTYPPQGPRRIAPESPHPSPERIAELASVRTERKDQRNARTEFELKVPVAVLEGHTFYVDCYVPQEWPKSRIAVSLAGVASTERARDSIRTRLKIDYAPCGTWQAVCAVSTGQVIEREVQVRGSCDS